ncbi:MAG: hypothetical protein ACOCP9_00385 [Halofilum sp. (in: g-proteobacteria)]
MDTNAIPLKTPRGREEIRTRTHRLSPMARRLLIIADGQHTITELAADLACGKRDRELHETLEGLVEGQFLHIRDDFDGHTRATPQGPGWHAIR